MHKFGKSLEVPFSEKRKKLEKGAKINEMLINLQVEEFVVLRAIVAKCRKCDIPSYELGHKFSPALDKKINRRLG